MGAVEESNSVVSPAAARRPSAERKGLRPGGLFVGLRPTLVWAGLWCLGWWLVPEVSFVGGDSVFCEEGAEFVLECVFFVVLFLGCDVLLQDG